MTQMTQKLKIPSICAAPRLGQPSAAPWPNRDPNDLIMQNSHNVKIIAIRGWQRKRIVYNSYTGNEKPVKPNLT